MSDGPLYIKHRPSEIEDVMGNEATKTALESILSRKDGIPHAFLFCGPSGCGKTTLARIVCSRLNIHEQETHEINTADFRGIDSVRDIRDAAGYRPMYGENQAWILDECHKLTSDAQGALLKMTEDAPKRAYFFFCTTDPQKIIPTLRNRCTTFTVESLEPEEVERLLRATARKEGVTIPADAVAKIANNVGGSSRAALVLLDKIIDIQNDEDMMAAIDQSIAETAEVIDLCRALHKVRPWKEIARILSAISGKDPEQIRYAVMGYFSSILLKGVDDPAAILILDIFSKTNFMYSGKAGLIVACYEAVAK